MRTRKRRYQKGCLRNVSGAWIVKYYDATGRHRTETLGRSTGPQRISRNEAERRRADFMAGINSEKRIDTMTVAQFVERRFLPTRRDNVLKPVRAGTIDRQEQRLNRYVLPIIGGNVMAQLEQEDLRNVLRQACLTPSLGQEMLRKIRADLTNLCKTALGEGILSRSIWVGLPRAESVKPPAEKLTIAAEQYSIALATLTERDRLVFDLIMFVGLRASEVFGLQIGNIGADHIRIERSLYEGDINKPKTLKSRRRIGAPAAILARLRAYSEGLAANHAEAWLFPSTTVLTPEWPDNAMDNRIRPALKSVGLGWLTYAILRRTFSTLHRAAGTEVDLIAYQQGHTKKIHVEEYVQYTPSMLTAQLEAVYSKFLEMPRENRAN